MVCRTILLATCLICRRRRRRPVPEKQSPSRPLEEPFEKPVTRVVEVKPRKESFVSRFTRKICIAEELPALDHRLPHRRSSVAMEPIPEVRTPRPSMDTRKPDAAPVEEPPPVVQHNAAPSRAPTDPMFLAEEPIKTT